jgi:ABC-type transporter Mla MlaB component
LELHLPLIDVRRWIMLRITIRNDSGAATLKLEGKLASVWVDEAGRCARAVMAASQNGLAVDLTDVSFVDVSGKRLLRSLVADGARLISDDPAMDALVEEVTAPAGAPWPATALGPTSR